MKTPYLSLIASSLVISSSLSIAQSTQIELDAQNEWKREGWLWAVAETCDGEKGLQTVKQSSTQDGGLKNIKNLEQGHTIAQESGTWLRKKLGAPEVNRTKICDEVKPKMKQLIDERRNSNELAREGALELKKTGVLKDALFQRMIIHGERGSIAKTQILEIALSAT